MTITLFILHGLCAVALLGALTHQSVALLRSRLAVSRTSADQRNFVDRYVAVGQGVFVNAVVVLYLITFVLGAVIYPAYRLDVRIPFEEMALFWGVGLFEVKEHWAGIGVGCLPLYLYVWRAERAQAHRTDRLAVTLILSVIVWTDFLVGHVLNNIRGLG